MTDCANATLAIGASPTMTNAVEEVAEMAAAARALVLNLGTLQAWTLEAMLAAGKSAAAHGVPIVFDPVGAGGTTFRTQAALRLLFCNQADLPGTREPMHALARILARDHPGFLHGLYAGSLRTEGLACRRMPTA